jgi:tetratricopeptide (TPR) repeat protein
VSLNICNACIYLRDNVQAVRYADKAIRSSKLCMNSISKKMDKLTEKEPNSQEEYQQLYKLFTSQIKLHIQGYQAKGQAYEKTGMWRDAIVEYNQAKQVVEKNFGTDNSMFKDLVSQISAANINLKTMNYAGRESKPVEDKPAPKKVTNQRI